MLNQINGLPAHVLLLHVVVVLIPLAALLAILGSVWRAVRKRLGILTPLTALTGLIFVPLTTSAGEWLRDRVPSSDLVRRHAELGDGLLIWAALLFALSAGIWLLDLSARRGWHLPAALLSRATRTVATALLVVVAVVAVVEVYRIGDSGAKAAWNNRLTPAAVNDRPH